MLDGALPRYADLRCSIRSGVKAGTCAEVRGRKPTPLPRRIPNSDGCEPPQPQQFRRKINIIREFIGDRSFPTANARNQFYRPPSRLMRQRRFRTTVCELWEQVTGTRRNEVLKDGAGIPEGVRRSPRLRQRRSNRVAYRVDEAVSASKTTRPSTIVMTGEMSLIWSAGIVR